MALGVKIDVPPETIGRAIAEIGVGFMFAPAQPCGHAARRSEPRRARHPHHLQPPRAAVEPRRRVASAGRRVLARLGRADRRALGELGSDTALVVHGSDGMDEITTAGRSFVARLKHGEVTNFEIDPGDAGVAVHPPGAVAGGNAEETPPRSAVCSTASRGPIATPVLMNAGAALMVAGSAATLKRAPPSPPRRSTPAGRHGPRPPRRLHQRGRRMTDILPRSRPTSAARSRGGRSRRAAGGDPRPRGRPTAAARFSRPPCAGPSTRAATRSSPNQEGEPLQGP